MYQLNRCLLACLTGTALILPAGVHAALTAEHVFATLKPELRKQLQSG